MGYTHLGSSTKNSSKVEGRQCDAHNIDILKVVFWSRNGDLFRRQDVHRRQWSFSSHMENISLSQQGKRTVRKSENILDSPIATGNTIFPFESAGRAWHSSVGAFGRRSPHGFPRATITGNGRLCTWHKVEHQ